MTNQAYIDAHKCSSCDCCQVEIPGGECGRCDLYEPPHEVTNILADENTITYTDDDGFVYLRNGDLQACVGYVQTESSIMTKEKLREALSVVGKYVNDIENMADNPKLRDYVGVDIEYVIKALTGLLMTREQELNDEYMGFKESWPL